MLFENKKEFLELLSYGSRVESQISYDRKNVYHSLITEYLTKKINPGRFRSKFLQMHREDGEAATMIKKDLEQLASFSIDLKADEFSSLIEQIYYYLNLVLKMVSLKSDSEILLKKFFLKWKNISVNQIFEIRRD